MPAVQETIDRVRKIDVDQYKYGFETAIETDKAPKGLSEDIIRFISAKKGEPDWMLEWRLEAYRRWLTLEEPTWARVDYPKIDFNDIYYYAAPKSQAGPTSLAEVDPELLKVYEKLGIPLREQEILAGVTKAAPVEGAEEWAIHDYEGFGGVRIAEYASFERVSEIASFLAEHGEIGAALIGHYSGDLDEAREAMADRYLGAHASLADYVQEVTEETTAIPHALRYYIDYAAMARDAELNGDLFTVSTAFDVVHIFAGC